MKIKGKDIVLSVNGRPLAASKSCTFQVQQEFVEACSPVDGRAKQVIPGQYGWTASADCLCNTTVDADTFIDMIANGTQLTIRFTDADGGFIRTGNAYVQSVSASGNVNGLATVQLSLQGSGPLSNGITFATREDLATGVFLTYNASGFVLDEDNTVEYYRIVLTKRQAVRIVFEYGSASVDVMKSTAADLKSIIQRTDTQEWGQSRVNTLHAGGTAHSESILLNAGEYCFCVNENDGVRVGTAVNSISTLSEE